MKAFTLSGTRRVLLSLTLTTTDGETFPGVLMMNSVAPASLPGACLDVGRPEPTTGEIKSPDDKEYFDRLKADYPPNAGVIVTIAGKTIPVRVKSWA